MFNRVSLGATVVGIFLLAAFGINRAFSWLRDSLGTNSFADSGELVKVGENKRARNPGSEFVEDSRVPNDPNSEHSLTRANQGMTSRLNSGLSGELSRKPLENGPSEDVLTPTPLETNGIHIPRPQGSELDPSIVDSRFEATQLSTEVLSTEVSPDDATSRQADTQLDQLDPSQISEASPVDTSATSRGLTAPTSQSVPALW